MSPDRRRRLAPAAAAAALLCATGLLLGGCAGAEDGGAQAGGPVAPTAAGQGGHAGKAAPDLPVADAAPREIPALGPKTLAQIPDSTHQAVVVTGDAPDSNRGTAQRYVRETAGEGGWRAVGDPWPTRNALKGWTDHHVQGDLKSPIGVFGLTDAGGHEPDPGTELPYDRGPAFVARGTNVEGEPLGDAFDYVVAVNYNRKPGTTPLDWTRPLGASRGGGIWFHVDHGGPTQGCISQAKAQMKELLRWLEPAAKPVVVMGDAGALGR